jgi:two-component system nitrate/nitrite response regulator NarL
VHKVNNIQKARITSDLNVIRVIIADKQDSFRRALRTALEYEGDVTIVGEASDASGIFALVGQIKPDVLLIEAALLDTFSGRLSELDGIGTLVTVSTLDRATVIRAFLHGAKAVVPKPSAPHVWPDSIRTVVAGQYWLESEAIAILVLALRDYFFRRNEAKSPRDYKLTPREVEIIDKVANGHSNKEVGLAFSIRERTVKHHLTNIFTKIGVSSRLELALFAVNHRLLDAPFLRDAISLEDVELVKLGGGAS